MKSEKPELKNKSIEKRFVKKLKNLKLGSSVNKNKNNSVNFNESSFNNSLNKSGISYSDKK